jgi:hypothetical protein
VYEGAWFGRRIADAGIVIRTGWRVDRAKDQVDRMKDVRVSGSNREGENGALDRIRTCGLCLRRAALYPLSYERGSAGSSASCWWVASEVVRRGAVGGASPSRSRPDRKHEVVPKKGLEPPRANAHYALNVARLPIPPLRL